MMAGLLAGVLILQESVSASAGEPPVQMIIRGDAFQNRQINISATVTGRSPAIM